MQKSTTSMTMRAMRTLLITLALVGFGCGDSGNKDIDAAAPPIDSPAPPDAPVVAQNCTTYCKEVTANCTGANLQYLDMAHCTGSCAAFPVGMASDIAGNTLGCRIYHGGTPSMTGPAQHCPHAGPGGDVLSAPTTYCTDSGGDVCKTFCTLALKTCGTAAAPVTVGGVAITPPYADMTACTTACAGFDKTHNYVSAAPGSGGSLGNSLACRVNHWTNAAANAGITPPTMTSGMGVQTHCGHIVANPPTGTPCSGTPMP